MLNFKFTDLIFGDCNFCHKFSLGVSIVCVRRLSNEACESLKNYFFCILLLLALCINIGVILNHSIASVRKELQMYTNALRTSHCQLAAKHECYVSQGSVLTLFR